MCCGLRLRCVWLLLTVLVACCLFLPASPKAAEAAQLSCGPFAGAPSPQPRQLTRPPQRMAEIEAEASARSFPVVFLGDSLTQLWGREKRSRPLSPRRSNNSSDPKQPRGVSFSEAR